MRDDGVGMPSGRLVLAEHDPAWARAFEVEAAAIHAALGELAVAVGWDKGAYSLAKGPFIDRLAPRV